MIRGVILGLVLALVLGVVGGYVAITQGVFPANADARPPAIERWMARTSLHATLAREAPTGDNPLASNDATLTAGMKLYVANCAVCHGTSAGQATNVAHGLYQRPPQLAADGVEDDPAGVTFWKIKHGIRLTGMPSYAETLSDEQIWQVTAFLQKMDALPPAVGTAWMKERIAETIAPAALQRRPHPPGGDGGPPGGQPPPQ